MSAAVVALCPTWCEESDCKGEHASQQPSVSLCIGGEGADSQADLHLHGAEALLEELTRAVRVLRGDAGQPEAPKA